MLGQMCQAEKSTFRYESAELRCSGVDAHLDLAVNDTTLFLARRLANRQLPNSRSADSTNGRQVE